MQQLHLLTLQIIKGASKGEGLGNKFLSHIREVDAIIHLVRCLILIKYNHVNNKFNRLKKILKQLKQNLLSDVEAIQKKLENQKKNCYLKKKCILEKSLEMLNNGNDLSSLERSSITFLNQIGFT